jgi:tetratricopeptide (TPR) repeat protein
VNTGRALVRLSVDPATGEGFLVGDPVNTAARLQAVAPPGGVVVGDLTRSMTAQVAAYTPMKRVRLKGKQRTIRPWLVTGGIARPGLDLRRSFATDFVGREVELGILTGMFDKALASSTPQIAVIVGDAGLGKTRLLHELARWLDERPDVIAWWRQAQCPAYGEGSSMWPLAQIARNHAGIVDGDDGGTIAVKLRRTLHDAPDGEWLVSRLCPLLGLSAQPASKAESFAAWLRFIELMARSKPTVLAFEDLHWASPLMVEFLGYVERHIDAVPLLGIGTARPEFLQAHPDYQTARAADEKPARRVQLDLHPLTAPEVDRLVSSLTRNDETAATRDVIAERCGGNPLFAEELARLLQDRADAARGGDGSHGEAAQAQISASLEALIAARLDSLKPDLKGLLSDAAVLGEEFSTGVLAAVSGQQRSGVEAQLQELAMRELIRPGQQASRSGDASFVFWHALTRDVAYGQLTRSDRASKHLAVAEYMQGQDAARTGDSAEIVAHHYTKAFELIQATGDTESADRLREPAASALAAAADRSMALDCARAKHQYQAGLDLLTDASPLRAQFQAKLGRALIAAGEPLGAVDTLQSAIVELNAKGDRNSAAVVMMDLYGALLDAGDPRTHVVARQAVAALDDASPSPELITVLEGWACAAIQLGLMEDSLAASGRCLEASKALGARTPIMALACRAWASCATGRIGDGVQDAHRLLELLRDRSGPPLRTSLYSSIAELFALYGSVAEARSVLSEGLQLAERRHEDSARWALRICELELLSVLGHWDTAISGCRELDAELSATDVKLHLMDVRCLSAILRTLRGDLEAAAGFLEWWRSEQTLYFGQPSLDCLAAALAGAALGHDALACQQLQILATESRLSTGVESLWWPEAVRTSLSIGRPDLACLAADRALESKAFPDYARITLIALRREATGEVAIAKDLFEQASRGWARVGCPFEVAEANLGQARCLLATGKSREAAAAMDSARLTFTRLKANLELRDVQLLAMRL